jgi:AbrB family looped-hinge helix DNA binding protein
MKTKPKTRDAAKSKGVPPRKAPRTFATEPTRVGSRGTVVIPARLRKLFGLSEGSTVLAEARPEGVLLRPATVVPVETYTPERIAEFLLSTAIDAEDYRRAERDVRAMGIDPKKIPHYKPRGA